MKPSKKEGEKAGTMAPCGSEFGSQYPCKSQGPWHASVTPGLWKQKQVLMSRAHWLALLASSGASDSVRDPVSNRKMERD